MAGSVPPIPPVGTPPSSPTNTRERSAPETTPPPQPQVTPRPENPVDSLETVARVPVDTSIESLPELLLSVPPDTVIKGIITPTPDGRPARLESEFGPLSFVASGALPIGRLLSLQVQSADVHLVAVPVALDDKSPTPSFPDILTLAPVTALGAAQATADDHHGTIPAPAAAPLAIATESERNAPESPHPLPRHQLPAAIAELPIGARIAGTLVPVATTNKFLFVAQDTVLGLILPHQLNTPAAPAHSLAVPATGARLELEIRGVATHLNAQLVAIADVPITNAKTSVILGPAYATERPVQKTSEQARPAAQQNAASRPAKPGLSIGETVQATVHMPINTTETPSSPSTSGPPGAAKLYLGLRGYGVSHTTGTALLPGALVTATVVGHDQQGALLVGVADQTLRIETGAPFPPGTSLTFEILPPPPNDLSTLVPPPEASAARLQLDSLVQVIQALAAGDPNAHQSTIANVLPNSSGGAMAKLIAYLFALKNGDAKQWLGDRASSALERIGRGALLGRLGDELRSVERGIGETANEWRQVPLPFHDGDRLGMVTAWLYNGRRDQDDGDAEKPEGETHVIIDLTLSRLGEIRIDGTYRPGQFDMTIASEAPFEDPVRYNMIGIFDDILAVSGMVGALSFRAHASTTPPDTP